VDEKEEDDAPYDEGKKLKKAKRKGEVEDPVDALWKGEARKGDVKLISKYEVEFVVPQYWLQASR
jgi:hypothetical protein